MPRNQSSLGRAGERTLQFIEYHQQQAITNRNKGTPVLKSKIKLRKKTLRG